LNYQVQRYGIEKATGKLERTLHLSGQYADAVSNVAIDLGVPCLNTWKEMQDSGSDPTESIDSQSHQSRLNNEQHWSKYLSDGLHLSREGNVFVGRRVVDIVNKYFPDIAVHSCPHTGFTGNSSSTGGKSLNTSYGAAAGPWHDEIDYLNPQSAFQSRNNKHVTNGL